MSGRPTALPQDLVRAVYQVGIDARVLKLKDRLVRQGCHAGTYCSALTLASPAVQHAPLQVAGTGCMSSMEGSAVQPSR